MTFIALIITIIASLLLIIATIAFLKAKDVFMMTHVVMITNCYIIPLLLIGIGIEKFSLISTAKIITLIALNIVVASLLCHVIVRRAMINKITPDAEVKN
jgi:multisubunit Na+/H+ antiporter MnhG subunit